MAKQESIEFFGKITEALGNSMFRVQLDNGVLIMAQVSGKMRKFYIKVIPGDKVKVEMSPYDLTKGRIVSRIQDKTTQSLQQQGSDDTKKNKKKREGN